MDTGLIASVATFRVFTTSNGVKPRETHDKPPTAKERMASTPVTEGPLILSKLELNEVTYLQVNGFTRAIMPKSRLWRVSPCELVIPASFSTYWLVTLHGDAHAISKLDRTLKPLCKYEIEYDEVEEVSDLDYDSDIESDPFSKDNLSQSHSARVQQARQVISKGQMSNLLNDVNMDQTPWSTHSPPPKSREEVMLNTPPVSPPSVGSDKNNGIEIELCDLKVTSPPRESRILEPTPESEPSQITQSDIDELDNILVLEESHSSIQPMSHPNNQGFIGTELVPDYLPEEAAGVHLEEPQEEAQEEHTLMQYPSYNSIPTFKQEMLHSSVPDNRLELNDKFAPRFSHPLIPQAHISRFYPIKPPVMRSMGQRGSLPKRELTSVGPSNLHQEVTTVGGYIGLRAVKGLLRKT